MWTLSIAFEDAILEAIQSRAAFVAGSREDLVQLDGFASLGYSAARDALTWWLTPTAEKIPAPSGLSTPPADIACCVRELAHRLREERFWPIIFVPLSPPDANIVAVRVLVPSCSQASPGNIRLGRTVLEKSSENGSGKSAHVNATLMKLYRAVARRARGSVAARSKTPRPNKPNVLGSGIG